MSKFAEYSPGGLHPAGRGNLPEGLAIRPASEADVREMAEISAEREGRPDSVEELETSLRSFLVRERALCLVATRAHASHRLLGEGGRTIAGLAKVAYFVPPSDAPANVVPEGWYLSGVIVRPAYRRLGIGSELTRARLAWIAERGDAAYYFAAVRNLASVDLHAVHGFEAVTTDFYFPMATFTSGVGMLFRRDLRRLPRRPAT